jgi:hypothetical protein
MLALGALALSTGIGTLPRVQAGLGGRRIDPAQVIPMDQVDPEARETVEEVIRDHTFHRQGDPETFPCPSSLYLTLVNEPALTLALWRDLSTAPVSLRRLSQDRYEGTDGQGSSGTWDYVLRSPRLHVLLSRFNYVSPRGNARIDARIVLIVRSNYLRDVSGESLVKHDIEAFVKVDSRGWKTLARTLRPVIERVLEDQVQEAGWFVSLMSRLVLTYPNWACQVAISQDGLDETTKQKFRQIVVQNRRADATDGRPVVVQNQPQGSDSTVRR